MHCLSPSRLQFLHTQHTKTDRERLLRICGYGVPDLERALYSAANSLTLIAQAELQPYDKNEKGGYKTKEMHFYTSVIYGNLNIRNCQLDFNLME